MLKRDFRLLSPVSKNSKTLTSDGFNIRFLENGLSNSRFGFIVSKSVEKRATARNRAKRVIRSIVEENIKNIKEGYDFLFILKKSSMFQERAQVEEELLGILKKESLYA